MSLNSIYDIMLHRVEDSPYITHILGGGGGAPPKGGIPHFPILPVYTLCI